jgi:hypothetical protein
MIGPYLAGQNNPMLWTRADVETNGEATLTLTP